MRMWSMLAGVMLVISTAGGTSLVARDRAPQAPSGRPAVQFYADPKPLGPLAVTTIDGRRLQSEDFRGKVLLVNFWATWCPPCVTEVPDLVRLQAKYDGQLVILGISEDHGQVDIVKTFAAAKKVNYPLVMNTQALGALFPGLIGLPTTYVIDQQGRIVQKHVGQLNMAKTEAEVQALIEAGAGGSGRPGGL